MNRYFHLNLMGFRHLEGSFWPINNHLIEDPSHFLLNSLICKPIHHLRKAKTLALSYHSRQTLLNSLPAFIFQVPYNFRFEETLPSDSTRVQGVVGHLNCNKFFTPFACSCVEMFSSLSAHACISCLRWSYQTCVHSTSADTALETQLTFLLWKE